MKLRIPLLLIIISQVFSVKAQDYDKTYFRSPVNIAIKLAGNFGEIRPNHFHSGIDIKVPYSGVKLYAAADGYVSRIRKSPGGYGNALYITHSNGLMTVYGHMQKFNKELEAYSEKIQYAENRFEYTKYPDVDELPVKKGDLIGYAGNTGRSYGPHLHFEIREAEKDIPINPMLFDFSIVDKIPPKIFNLATYPIDKGSSVLGSSKKQKFKLYKKGNTYHVNKIITFKGKIGFAFKAYDYLNATRNSQGIYSVKMYLDDTLVYSHKLDKISFYETRYLNSFIDYEERQISNDKYQKCFIEPGNKLSIYGQHVNQGILDVNDNKTHLIKIIVSDINNNFSNIQIKIKGDTTGLTTKENDNNLKYNTDNYFVKDNIRAFIKEGSLYTDLDIKYSASKGSEGLYSDIHKINSYLIPLHENMHVAISTLNVPKKLLNKALIIYIDKKNRYKAIGGHYINGFIAAKSKSFGKFAIAVDQNPPTIILENSDDNYDYSKKKKISFKITDDLSGIGKYYAKIDGNPIIFEYDKKNNRISYIFDDHIVFDKKHTLKITVFDKKNNKSVFQTIFFK